MGRKVVAILGGRGMLGTDLVAACTRKGLDVRIYDLPEWDITNAGHRRQMVRSADVLINAAAYTNVDGAEADRQLAHRANAEAVGCLGELARDSRKWMLHFSTDFVFDGKLDRPYKETDAPNPINEYGKSKLTGERLLRESGCSYCIVRLQWTYGRQGNNFITRLLKRAQDQKVIKVVNDQVGSPTATTEVAKAVCDLLEKKAEGLFHFASAGFVSRYDIAAFVFNHLGRQIDLQPCRTSDLPAPAARPLNSRFDCSKIQPLLSEPIRPWQEPLEEFLKQL